ncbi:MAG TPA: TIGR04454 family lipoprotein [Leptospiraceae bacterium]|nr:TIGR04454 family lipoprotein [Leptospiraceae bacterium]
MRKINHIVMYIFMATFVNCSNKVVPSDECIPVVEAMFENFQKLNPDKAQSYADQKHSIMSVLQKECESGKYRLDCLKTAKDSIAIQACKN